MKDAWFGQMYTQLKYCWNIFLTKISNYKVMDASQLAQHIRLSS